jgi:hypothetical protein
MWDPYDDPERRRPRQSPSESGPDEPWTHTPGPRAPSARSRAVLIAVVALALLVSLFVGCVLLLDVLSFAVSPL